MLHLHQQLAVIVVVEQLDAVQPDEIEPRVNAKHPARGVRVASAHDRNHHIVGMAAERANRAGCAVQRFGVAGIGGGGRDGAVVIEA